MDRSRSPRSFDKGTVCPYRVVQSKSLLSSCARGRAQSHADEAHRRNVHGEALPRLQSDYSKIAQGRVSRQSQTNSGDHAADGISWNATWPQHVQASPGTSQISLPVAGSTDFESLAGLEFRHNVHSLARWLYLPRSGHRLVQSTCSSLSPLKQPGRGVLHRSVRRGYRTIWEACDFQYRSRGAIFIASICQCRTEQGNSFQHGRTRAGARQRFCRTSMEICKI